MKAFLLQIFTWWNGQTLGTRFHTWRKGEMIGEDSFGNRYFRARNSQRRWVIYNGEADPSRIPPGWHGWMHYRTDIPPTDESYTPKNWQKPHQPNLTGSAAAYRPKGSALTRERRPDVTGDYDAWSP